MFAAKSDRKITGPPKKKFLLDNSLMASNALVSTSSSQSATRSEFDIDALPYVDREIDEEGMKASVDRMIEQEMRRMRRKEKSTLPTSINLFEHDEMLAEELERVQKKEPLNALDTSRYELQGPADDNENVEGWKSAVDNTKAQLESQAGSMFNLELLQKYGANAWRVHNYQLQAYLKQVQKETEEYINKSREINKQRKFEQTQAAGSLRSLENKWSDLISQNLQVDIACAALESEVEELKRYKQSVDL
ncbi:Pre-mRNA-splicing factor SPF27 [Phycomyces nitens]|nr:Pre-mRNA-splicing factor SPF27 [Phycomyces nitens]